MPKQTWKTLAPQLRLVWQLSLPAILTQITTIAMQYIDSAMVGALGADASAAIGLVASSTWLFGGVTTAVSAGFSVQVAHRIGAGEDTEARTVVRHGLAAALTLAALLALLGLGICRQLPYWLGGGAEICADASAYFLTFSLMLPFSQLNSLTAGFLQCAGDMVTPSVLNAVMCGLDMVCNALLIPHFGVLGAALATDISQVISGVLSFIYLRRKFDVLKMEKNDLAFSKKACARLLGIGIPMGLQCSITAIGSVIMQWAVNVLGSTAVAAVTAAGKTQGLLTVPMESVGTAMATYAGQNLGASRMDRVRQGVNSAMLIILIYGVASAFVLHFTDVQIMSLFLDTAKEVDIVAMGREYLFWNSVFFVPLGALIIWRYSIQGLGFSSLAMLAGVAEMVARTAVAIVLVPVLGYFGAELSNPAAWIAACLFLYPAYRWTCRQLDNRLLTARLHIQGDHAETVL